MGLQRGTMKFGGFIILIAVMASWVYTYAKIYQNVRFKYVWFIACQLYLNRAVKDEKIISDRNSDIEMIRVQLLG